MDKSIGTAAPTGMVMTSTLLQRLPTRPRSVSLGTVERRASFFGRPGTNVNPHFRTFHLFHNILTLPLRHKHSQLALCRRATTVHLSFRQHGLIGLDSPENSSNAPQSTVRFRTHHLTLGRPWQH